MEASGPNPIRAASINAPALVGGRDWSDVGVHTRSSVEPLREAKNVHLPEYPSNELAVLVWSGLGLVCATRMERQKPYPTGLPTEGKV